MEKTIKTKMNAPEPNVGLIQANIELPLGLEIMRYNGQTVLVYTIPGASREANIAAPQGFISKAHFTALSGGNPGFPPLIKIAYTASAHSVTFTHIWIDANAVMHVRLGELPTSPGKTFEDIIWKTYEIPNADAEKAADLWAASIEKKEYKIIYPEDEALANQILVFRKGKQETQMVGGQTSSRRRLSLVEQLNANYKLADKMSLPEMKQLLFESEKAYYDEAGDPVAILDDRVYDYIKDLYRVKSIEQGTFTPDATGKGHVPASAERFLETPTWMGSLDKINHGDGQLQIWKAKFPGPYVVSAKMDGASALYFTDKNGQAKLYGNSDKTGKSQDISELLQYLNLPSLAPGVMVRGELILKKSVFAQKYKKTGPTDKVGYRLARSAIGGLVNKLGSRASGSKSSSSPLDVTFIRDVEFIAYEVITKIPIKCSEQYTYLNQHFAPSPQNRAGIAPSIIVPDVTDDYLSSVYDAALSGLDYEVDGLVVCSDAKAYERPVGENPSYAKAYKKPLASLTGVATVLSIEWNISKDNYIKPVVIMTPIELEGATIERATGYNAKFIAENKIGPGAIIEVTRAGGVIPKIINVVQEAMAAPDGSVPGQMPGIMFRWNSSGVEIIADPNDPVVMRDVTIKKLSYFLKKVGTKGIGETTVAKMYDIGVTSIPVLFQLQEQHLQFLGPKIAQNIIATLREHTANIPMPVLAAVSGVFGRGFGVRKFTAIFNAYPNILESDVVKRNDIPAITNAIQQIDGFAGLTASQVAVGFAPFMQFLDQLRAVGYNPQMYQAAVGPAAGSAAANHPFAGMNVVLTGFRDEKIKNFVESIGGKIQSAVSGNTDILVIKDGSYENTKTDAARKKGVRIMTRQEFTHALGL